MNRVHVFSRVLIALLILCAVHVNAESNADITLSKIIDDHWQYSLSENPIMAGRMGVAGSNHLLPSVAPADLARRHKAEQAFLARLLQVKPADLSASAQINHALLTWVLQHSVEDYTLYTDRIPLNTFYSFVSAAVNASKGLPMRTAQDYRDYISRLNAFGRYFDENLANMRQGIADGFVLPKIVVAGIAPTVRAQVYQNPIDSSLYEPFTQLPDTLSKSEQEKLQFEAQNALKKMALPALARVAAFLEVEYMSAATNSLGVEQLPNGKAIYRHAIRGYVTQDISAADVHRIGLGEVKRIRAEMDALIKSSGFKGDFAAFTHFLRTDPQFYAKTPEELLKAAAYLAKRIDYQLPAFFGHLPRTPYGIVPVPKEIAPNYTSASYNPAPIGGIHGGAYWLNTHNLDQRPLYELPALTLHEAVPGHHLQGALSQELENVPNFRRNLYLSAFGEGWGLYAERLGTEMDLYDTPYEHFGRLSYEMWRACRLVIDTGIHSQGWSRDKALAFLSTNTALSMDNVRAEVDRYISWPGQALSYKMGEIKIRELRARTEKALGDKFDIREFHDTLLSDGALPLVMLDTKMQAYLDSKAK